MLNLDPVQQEFCDQSNERALLALAINDTDNFYNLLTKTTTDEFLSPDSRRLYDILLTLHNAGIKKFDIHVIVKAAEELGYSDLCDMNYVTAITNINVATENFDVYLKRQLDISTKFKLNQILDVGLNTVRTNAGLTSKLTSGDLLSHVQADILQLSTQSLAVEEPKHVAEGLDEYIESIKDDKVEMRGLSTGFPILDQKIDGQVPGTLMIIAARKKMGKSALLTNMAYYAAIMEGKPVLYVDTEMPFEQWRGRVLAMSSGIKERTILHGGFAKNKDIMYQVTNAVKKLKDSKLFHQFMPGYSVEKLAALYQKYKLQEKIELGVFDYIKEPDSSSTDANRKEHQILGDVTTKLKDLAGQLNIPFLAAVQINRSGDIADSDRVARYADLTAFWEYRDPKMIEEVTCQKFEGEELKEYLAKHGHYQLTIRDSRRGGTTPITGIGYRFLRDKLIIQEVDRPDQIETIFDEEDAKDYTTGLNDDILR